MEYTREEISKINRLSSEVMMKLYGYDKSGRLLRLFIHKLIAISKLKGYGIDDENKLYVVTKDEYEKFKDDLKGDSMEIKKNITIKLSENDVKEIIADFLQRDGYNVTVDDVSLSVGSRCEGFGAMEHYVSCFNCAFVKCKEK